MQVFHRFKSEEMALTFAGNVMSQMGLMAEPWTEGTAPCVELRGCPFEVWPPLVIVPRADFHREFAMEHMVGDHEGQIAGRFGDRPE